MKMIYWYCSELDEVKYGSINAYKIKCMGDRDGASETGCDYENKFDGILLDEEWLG